jgi:hypothetical protein
MGKIIVCKLCGEEKKSFAKGFCKNCYNRVSRAKGLLTKACTQCKKEYPNTREYFGLTNCNGLVVPSKKITRVCVDCTTSTTRKCNTCNQILPIDSFDPYAFSCLICRNKKYKAKIKNDKDRYAEYKEKANELAHKRRHNLVYHYVKEVLIKSGNNQPTELDITIKRAEIIAKRKSKEKDTTIYVKTLISNNYRATYGEGLPFKNISREFVRKTKRNLIRRRKALEIQRVLKQLNN